MNVPSAFLFATVILLLGNKENGLCGPDNHNGKDDDYYEDFYLRKIPKLRVSPKKVKEFFANHLSWFPMDDLKPEVPSLHRITQKSFLEKYGRKLHLGGLMSSVKNYTSQHIKMGEESLKNESAKVSEYIEKKHIGGKLKNMTHPFRPRGDTNHTTHHKYMMTTTSSTFDPCKFIIPKYPGKVGKIGPTIKIYRRRKDMRHGKVERHAKTVQNTTEVNNSSQVLETAEDMATDIAGRVTNLWKCVVGYRKTPQIRDVNYFLYTRRNVIEPEMLAVNYGLIENKTANTKEESVECAEIKPGDIADFRRISDENREIIKSNFLSLKAPTKILIHGYTGSYKDTRMAKIKDAYLSTGRFNVIQVDWETLAAPPCYIRVTHHARFVGEIVAKFIDGLYLVGLNMSLLHLVGFSLGAQVAGLAGNMVTLSKICRITALEATAVRKAAQETRGGRTFPTSPRVPPNIPVLHGLLPEGLDPALPLFLHTDSSGHLDKFDADFVDVIHTCGGILAMLDPVGHVDFYPNGGSRQPGCEFSNLKCSHSRAPEYFAESVSSEKKFTGEMCSSWEAYLSGCNSTVRAFMGEPCSISFLQKPTREVLPNNPIEGTFRCMMFETFRNQ